MKIKRLTPAIGAEITGIDLGSPLDNDLQQQVYDALVDNLVIFFPGQDIGADAQLQFGQTFGTVDKPHPVYPHVDGFQQVTLLENDGDRPPDTNAWHTDLTYYPNPPFASILHAQDIPETGGDTLWASMYAAYDALPEHIKNEVEDLEAIHDPGTFRNQFLGPDKDIEALNKSLGEVGSALHSIVKTHPATGKKFLYVNQSFTNQVYGYSSAESARLLKYLYDHINQPEFQIRHRWSKGDVAMWDNRVTQHYAVADYAPHYRRMHRVTVLDDMRTA
jgi:taurine dioxygenase